jgi:hypothetical protein
MAWWDGPHGKDAPRATWEYHHRAKKIKSRWLTEAEVKRHTDVGCLPPMKLDDVLPDQYFNPECDREPYVDPIARLQRQGQCTNCRKGRPDRNGTCCGQCELWWPQNGRL